MIKRSLNFFEHYGPVIQDGITFAGGYTTTISKGDADFITKDTLWDFKVSKQELKKEHTLQLIIYYILGLNSYECDFSQIKKLGIFNPRKNLVYEYEIKKISQEIMDEIKIKVIGYDNVKNNNINNLTITDIMKRLGCSRQMVMKFYNDYDMPLKKEKNKYVISQNEFLVWLLEMKESKRQQQRKEQIIAITFLCFICLMFVIFLTFILH